MHHFCEFSHCALGNICKLFEKYLSCKYWLLNFQNQSSTTHCDYLFEIVLCSRGSRNYENYARLSLNAVVWPLEQRGLWRMWLADRWSLAQMRWSEWGVVAIHLFLAEWFVSFQTASGAQTQTDQSTGLCCIIFALDVNTRQKFALLYSILLVCEIWV